MGSVVFVRRDNLKCRICKNCTFPSLQRWNCGWGKKRRWCSFSEALQRATATFYYFYPPMLLPVMAHIRAVWLVHAANHRPIRDEHLGCGANPPNTGSQGVWQTDRPKGDVGVSSLFAHPLESDRHCRQIGHEYHHARQKFGARSRKSFILCISLWIGGDLLCPLQITSYSNVISVL